MWSTKTLRWRLRERAAGKPEASDSLCRFSQFQQLIQPRGSSKHEETWWSIYHSQTGKTHTHTPSFITASKSASLKIQGSPSETWRETESLPAGAFLVAGGLKSSPQTIHGALTAAETGGGGGGDEGRVKGLSPEKHEHNKHFKKLKTNVVFSKGLKAAHP